MAVKHYSNTWHGGRVFLLTLFGLVTLGGQPMDHEILALNCASPAGDQVDNDHNHSQYQKQVDQAPANAKAKPKKPQNQEHSDDSPKHNFSSARWQTFMCSLRRGSITSGCTFSAVAVPL